jgi:hypothetical protein
MENAPPRGTQDAEAYTARVNWPDPNFAYPVVWNFEAPS